MSSISSGMWINMLSLFLEEKFYIHWRHREIYFDDNVIFDYTINRLKSQ